MKQLGMIGLGLCSCTCPTCASLCSCTLLVRKHPLVARCEIIMGTYLFVHTGTCSCQVCSCLSRRSRSFNQRHVEAA